MPTLMLHPRGTCALCGSRLQGVMVGCYRINKGSLRSTDAGNLTWLECPECGPAFARRHPLGIRPTCQLWRAGAESQAVIDAARARKGWV